MGQFEKDGNKNWICTHCGKPCETRGKFSNEKTDELLTEIRDLLVEILKALK